MSGPDPVGVVDLDDPACQDVRISGGKAALLARARARGFPVLDGLVVPAQASRRHLDLGAAALDAGGSGKARMAVTAAPLGTRLRTALAAESGRLGDLLAVRSSAVGEADGTWSGAFSSFLDIRPGEVERAVVGCWASTFTVAAIDRHLAAELAPGSMGMAVLIQPQVHPDFAGTARIEHDLVTIAAVAGSPAPLVSGWEPGEVARVTPDDVVAGAAAELMGDTVLRSVAAMIRDAASLGCWSCEWAVVDGDLRLLQLLSGGGRQARTPAHVPRGLDTAAARQVARMTRRFPGPLGEELVLPWALGAAAPPGPTPPLPIDPRRALDEALRMAARLTAQVWQLSSDRAGEAARSTLRGLRGPEPKRFLDQLASLSRPDPTLATDLIARLATVRDASIESGVVRWPETFWHLDKEQVERALAGSDSHPGRIGFDRWDPFNIGVLTAEGRHARGLGSSGGVGFGRARWISSPSDKTYLRPREVVVSRHPTPDLAPLLWDAAGVITTGGGPGAHLFESARSLGIPAVAGCNLEEVVGSESGIDGMAVAVDGTTGTIHFTDW
ncbi:MAG TPA: PEP/pyruvate-binding domain-containing protein [Acidimicrobiia bacterium]|nr:PEP/pyruvate-binding domain-containing protein [Acidimicrobiia bacterium]